MPVPSPAAAGPRISLAEAIRRTLAASTQLLLAREDYRAEWRRAIDAVVEMGATTQDIAELRGELRAEIREATATPFGPPRTVESDLLEDR